MHSRLSTVRSGAASIGRHDGKTIQRVADVAFKLVWRLFLVLPLRRRVVVVVVMERSGVLWRGVPIEDMTREELIKAMEVAYCILQEQQKSLDNWAQLGRWMRR